MPPREGFNSSHGDPSSQPSSTCPGGGWYGAPAAAPSLQDLVSLETQNQTKHRLSCFGYYSPRLTREVHYILSENEKPLHPPPKSLFQRVKLSPLTITAIDTRPTSLNTGAVLLTSAQHQQWQHLDLHQPKPLRKRGVPNPKSGECKK